MANTLTALQPVLFSAAQEVSNEPFGVVKSITTDFDDKGVAKGDNVIVPVAPLRTPADFTPAAYAASGDDAIASSVTVQITQSKKVSWHLTGEQIRSLENGAERTEWVRQMVAQGMRALRNYAEADACLQIKYGASRAYGTAGTTPFATDMTELTHVYKLLKDNGAPMADLQLVVDTTAALKLRNLGIIQQAQMAGSDAERRSGNFLRQYGFLINESAGIVLHAGGTATGITATTVANSNDVTLAGTTWTPTSNNGLSGDVITIATDYFYGSVLNKYVVSNGASGVGAKVGLLNRPGARKAVSAQAVVMSSSYTPNMAFERSAVVGVFRPPIIPENPTITQQAISDESGLTYLLLDIAQYGQRTWELHLAYGTKVVQPEHVVLLLG